MVVLNVANNAIFLEVKNNKAEFNRRLIAVCKIITEEINWDISQVDPRKTLEVCIIDKIVK